MCVIIYKPKGMRMPSNAVLEACWRANPHGAGLAFVDGEHVQIDKGYMSRQEFMRLVKSYRFTKNDEVALHFRWATSGGINQGACHPFPISRKDIRLKKNFVTTKEAFFHNGVFTLQPADGLSDTMTMVKRHLAQKGARTKRGLQALEQYRAGSRILLLKAGNIKRIGKWHKVNGLWYSNMNFHRQMMDMVSTTVATARSKYPAVDRPWKSTRQVNTESAGQTINIFDYMDSTKY